MTYLKCEISVQLHLLFVPLCMHVKQQNKILFCTCLCVFVHVSDYIFVFVYYTGLSPSHLWACVVSVMFGLFLFFYTHTPREGNIADTTGCVSKNSCRIIFPHSHE